MFWPIGRKGGKMDILLQFGLLVLGFVMLIKGADWFVDGAAGIASKLGIPQLIIGLTIVAMGTSAPEAAVSISSAMKGSADITIGNVVGSNIMNVLVILGLTASIVAIKVAKSTVRIEIPFMIGISALLLALGMTGNVITFVEGVVLWIAFIAYLAYLFVMAKKGKEKSEEETANDGKKKPLWLLAVLIAVGAAMIVLGSNFAVDGASAIATAFGLSERFIGLTIVALGTSLPELVTSVTAAKKGNADIAIGNIVGSNIFNILFVVGTTALITPVAFAPNFLIDSLVGIGAAVLLWIGCFRKNQLGRAAGIIMLLGYAAYFVYLL